MKKLLLIGTNSIHTLNYLNLIRDYFSEVYVLTDTDGKKYNVPFKCINFSFSNPAKVIQSILTIKKTLLEVNPDIIHVHQVGTHAWMALQANRKTNIPIVVTAWGSDILTTPKKGHLYHKMIKHILNNAKHFTSDSAFMADEMNRIANKKLNILIANFGINIDQTELPKEDILFSNRAHKPLYRIDVVLHAFSRFLNTSADNQWRLIIAGDGDQTQNLKSLATQLGISGRVDFVGWLTKEQNSTYYQKSKLFISIPESDATSISLLEAMAAGCVPIVSDLPANAEWITDGSNGIVVKDLSEDFISKALQLDYYNTHRINAEIIKRDGTKDSNRIKFFNLYDKILQQP
jgi:glycosyltransferase involved in cell wall biosynthesis